MPIYNLSLKFINKPSLFNLYHILIAVSYDRGRRGRKGEGSGHKKVRDDHGKLRPEAGFTPSYTT